MSGFDFDTGGGGEGPWISWTARGTQDGKVPAKNFMLRTQDSKQVFSGFDQGVVLDIRNMKTGWCYSTGVPGQPPKWVLGPSVAQLPEKPGDDYKKGFQIKCAIGGGETAQWDDSGAGAWNGFTDLVPEISAGPSDHDKLPMVKKVGDRAETWGKGSTVIPVLEIVQWVDRPDCLKTGVNSGFDAGPSEQAQAAQQAAAAQATQQAAEAAPAGGGRF